MSSYLTLSNQNKAASMRRKQALKDEIDEELLSGGVESSSSSLNESSGFDASAVNYQQAKGVSTTDTFLGLGAVAMDLAAEKAVGYTVDKAKDKISKKAAGEVGEMALKKAGKELGEMGVKKGLKYLGGMAATGAAAIGGFLACPPVAFVMAAIGVINTIKDIGDFVFVLDDLLNSVGIESEFVEKLQSAWENFWGTLAEKAYEGFTNTRDYLHDKTGLKMFEDEYDRAEREEREEREKRKREIEKIAKKAKARKRLMELEEMRKKDEEDEEDDEDDEEENEESLNSEENEKEDEENEDEEDEEDKDSQDSELDNKGKILNFLRKSGLLKGVVGSMGLLGGTLGVAYSLVGIYRTHYTGEFEYKGITAEYQGDNMLYQNFTKYDDDGNVVLRGLTKENKLVKTFYTKYSNKSYYAIVEDEEKYEDINEAYLRKNLLTPDELREQYPDIVDTNNRESHFQLNPDLLYTLDKYIHKDKVMYPQQFIKPVYYEEDQEKFALKNLIDDKSGEILAKSQVFADDGEPIKKSDGSYMHLY